MKRVIPFIFLLAVMRITISLEKIREMTDEDLKSVKNLSEKCYKEIKQAVYCTDCKRSIYGEYKNCDVNIENHGKYVLAGDKCGCKVV